MDREGGGGRGVHGGILGCGPILKDTYKERLDKTFKTKNLQMIRYWFCDNIRNLGKRGGSITPPQVENG